jgi:phosphoribosylglycinamide formyltransferase-1
MSKERSPAPVPGSRPFRVGVLASGRGSNLEAILDAIAKGSLVVEVAIVLSNRKEAHALERARNRGVPAEFVDPAGFPDRAAYDRALAQRLQSHKVDLVVLAGYMRLVSPALIRPFRDRIVNIHPSLLPAFPGLNAQRQALDHGVKVSGCTVHFVDEEVDHGPILLQAAVPIEEGETEESLSERILTEEHRLLSRAIQLIAEGRIRLEGRRVIIVEASKA